MEDKMNPSWILPCGGSQLGSATKLCLSALVLMHTGDKRHKQGLKGVLTARKVVGTRKDFMTVMPIELGVYRWEGFGYSEGAGNGIPGWGNSVSKQTGGRRMQGIFGKQQRILFGLEYVPNSAELRVLLSHSFIYLLWMPVLGREESGGQWLQKFTVCRGKR